MQVEIDVPDERIWGLLVEAFEGGSNYWAEVVKKDEPFGGWNVFFDGTKTHYSHLLPFNGGTVWIKDTEEPDNKAERLDYTTLEYGLKVMIEKYPEHFADFMKEEDDATTGDVFLQCCLFGEVIYG